MVTLPVLLDIRTALAPVTTLITCIP